MENIGIGTIAFLVLFPMLIALILLLVRNDKARTVFTVAGALVIACASIFCAVEFLPQGAQQFAVDSNVVTMIGHAVVVIDALLCVYVIGKGIRWKKGIAALLALIQLGLVLYLDLVVAEGIEVSNALYLDNLSIIMALVIGIVGSGIAVYALGYMRVHEAHNEGKDRRPVFFAIMFAFLGAMFAIVFSNSLTWMLCAWEITTVCSFALIGYTRTDEAIDNSFLQIVLNLIGGIAFTCALIWIGQCYGTMELDKFISSTQSFASSGYTIITYAPLLLFALAAFTKAAQMPFHKWLLGAMVAPTPTSALLHSSTMVKAGVFLLIKLAPCFGFNLPGYIVMIVGGVTFLFCALAAISQSNAKRVLAYSTISNLGLITACAGVGSDGAVWAAIFLLIFHAVAKSLLFLCVGTAEHHIGSRNIEDMDDLFERMPRLARLMAIGIMGMFIAPFGMLVSKWAALQAFAEADNIVLIMLLVFGSAATFMFWAKWLGKILAIANSGEEDVELTVDSTEWASLGLMTVLTVGCCIAFPLISTSTVVPYLSGVFGEVSSAISSGDLWIMAVIGLVVAVIFLGFTGKTKKRQVPVYMAGVGVDFPERSYLNSFGKEEFATQRNWYMEDIFGEKRMSLIGIVISLALILSSGAFVTQSVAAQRDQVESLSGQVVSYQNSMWPQAGASFEEYVYYYNMYAQYYEENKDALNEQMQIESMDGLMDVLLMQLYSSGQLGSGDATSSSDAEDAQSAEGSAEEGADSADEEVEVEEGVEE